MIENYSCENQMDIFDLDPAIWSSKTCQDSCHREPRRARTSESSLKKPRGSSSQMPLFLDLRSGRTADASWETVGQSPTLSTMLSTGAFLSAESGWLWLQTSMGTPRRPLYLTLNCGEKPMEDMTTKLSDILEPEADEKYRLSKRACEGILRRAEKRGKQLPEILREALEQQL